MKTNLFILFLVIFLSNFTIWGTNNSSGVFIFTTAEFDKSSEAFAKILQSNATNNLAIRKYVENDVFGFNEFKNEVIKYSADLKNVMIIFSFHGADAKKHFVCDDINSCLHGNLCLIDEKFISAKNIVDNILIPLEGKEIAVFFKSCFSGHFAYKVNQLAASQSFNRPTPIALIATDNNTETSNVCFPTPDYSFEHTKFSHWQDSSAATSYEQMKNFVDYVEFVNAYGPKFNFTFFAVNGGENIEISKFGFKNLSINPYQELQKKNKIYNQLSEKLNNINLSHLTVLFVETDRTYENLAGGDMWLKSFIQKGVLEENIHWIKPTKNEVDVNNPQIHSIFDNFDFIPKHHKVLLFIRGDDALLNEEKPQEWALIYGEDRILTAEKISELLIAKLQEISHVLVLFCSSHAEYGFNQLVSLLSEKEIKNVGVLSFYSPEQKLNNSTFAGWPMGFIAPLYEKQFLFKTDAVFKEIYPKDLSFRKKALENLEFFVKIKSFDDYLKFLQNAMNSHIPKEIAVKMHNVQENDLSNFAFMPIKIPQSWYQW